MEIFLYAIIFITGAFFGSFFTLAVYRIPNKEDILIKHSYCPNCNHRLGFFDLFPVLSYIFLGGKCRYCKNVIRPRYLILELLSGFTFLVVAISMKINVFNLNSAIEVAFLLIYMSILFIISGIDKEYIKIEKSVLIVGFIIEVIYIIYQYTLKNLDVYQYVIYLTLFTIIIFIFKKRIKEYYIQNIYLSLYMIIFNGIRIYIFTVILAFIINLIYKVMFKKEKTKTSIAYNLSFSNILIITISNLIINYIV